MRPIKNRALKKQVKNDCMQKTDVDIVHFQITGVYNTIAAALYAEA